MKRKIHFKLKCKALINGNAVLITYRANEIKVYNNFPLQLFSPTKTGFFCFAFQFKKNVRKNEFPHQHSKEDFALCRFTSNNKTENYDFPQQEIVFLGLFTISDSVPCYKLIRSDLSEKMSPSGATE